MGQDLTKHSKVSGNQEYISLNKVRSLHCSQATLKFSDKELNSLIKLFYNLAALSPQHSYIDKTTFEHYFPLGGILAKRLFVAFDTDRNGVIDLVEFLDGLALCLQGSNDEKYKLAFAMFDIDESNGVAPWELHLVLKSILSTTSRLLEPRFSQKEMSIAEMDCVAHRIVHDAFREQSHDLNEENKMTLKVFKTWVERHPFVIDSIFGHSCLKDKNLQQYSRLGNEDYLSGLSASVKKQTWVNSTHNPNEYLSSNNSFVDSTYAKADYLWSPVFAKVKSKPSKRCKLAVCMVYDSIYVYGGRGICTSLKDFWRYDIGENAWFPVEVRGENRPSYLQEHTMLSYKNSLVVFGGQFTSLNETPLWLFDLNTFTWSQPPRKQKGPVNRRGHSAVISGDVMYVFGGYIDLRGAVKELWKYNLSSNVWTREAIQSRWPSPRYSHSAVVFDKSMVIFGGLENMQFKNDMWLWNMACSKWTRIKAKNSPPPLFGHTAVKVGDGMIVFGGESTDGSLHNSLWRFNFESLSWSTITPKGMISPPARSYHSIVQIPHFLFTCKRPTSSRSAPPCTPKFERQLSSLEEEQQTEFLKVTFGKPLNSVASLGSLDSTALLSQTDDELVQIKVNKSGSLDSLVPSRNLREAENMSMTNHDRIEDDDSKVERLDIKPCLNANQKIKQLYGGITPLENQLKPVSANHLSLPINGPIMRCDSDRDTIQSAIVHLMVLGGTSKRGIESADRWIDMWKCQIDPEKHSMSIKKIDVQSTEGTEYTSTKSYDSKVEYTNFNITDTANDNEYYDDSDGENGNTTITECRLIDIPNSEKDLLDKTAGQSMTAVSI